MEELEMKKIVNLMTAISMLAILVACDSGGSEGTSEYKPPKRAPDDLLWKNHSKSNDQQSSSAEASK